MVPRAENDRKSKSGAPTKEFKAGDRAWRAPSKEEASLRAEAEAPFRSLRIVLFGFGAVSAVLATFFSLPTLIGALAGAPQAKPLLEAGQDFAINIGALGFCGYFLKGDLDAREKQMARLMREDALGGCQLELANGRVLRLAQLRGAARPIVIAGTASQVADALAAAEPHKQALVDRGVLLVPLPIYSSDGKSLSQGTSQEEIGLIKPLTSDDLRWRAQPIRIEDWKKWFDDQATAASKVTGQGLYVGLRMDGRVRASGVGCPPWAKFAAQLPPNDGLWKGFLDGMDGRVG